MFSEISYPRKWANWIYILMGIVLVLLASWMVAEGRFQWVLFLALLVPGIIVILLNPKVALIAIILSAFSLEYLAGQGVLPFIALWTVDGLVLLLFCRVLLLRGTLTGWFVSSSTFKLTLIWAVAVLLSALINSTPPVQAVLGLRAYLRLIVLYYCMLEFEWEKAFLEKAIRLVVFLVLLQIPVAIIQRIQGFGIDQIAGTLESTGIISVLAVAFSAGLIGYGMLGHSTRSFWGGIVVLVLPALATARAFVMIIPVVIFYTLSRLRRNLAAWHILCVVLGIALVLGNWETIQGRSIYRDMSAIDLLRSPGVVLDELRMGPVPGTQGASIGRLQGLQLAWERTSRSLPSLFLGYGPAASQGSRFAEFRSNLYEDLATSAGGRASILSTILLEWGLAGVIAYFFIFLDMWRKSEIRFRQESDPFWKSVAFAHATGGILMVGLAAYTTTFVATATALTFWFIGGALHRQAFSPNDSP